MTKECRDAQNLVAVGGTPRASAAPQDQNESTTIVVTGVSLADSEECLEACLARRCPPREDIEALLAHAENQENAARLDEEVIDA
ncbi:hypothetical protein ACMGDH_14190 [Sphingomonas sp. DT-207]|uniref:hypothetical protein n=1 Tax=Sphingomonas sp. DT-207 TaxID=3396167 RepID=UPI003F1B320E